MRSSWTSRATRQVKSLSSQRLIAPRKKKNVATSDDLAKTNTLLQILEQRATETGAGLKTTTQNLQETSAAMNKLHEDHENTKKAVAGCSEGFRKCKRSLEQTHAELESTRKQVGNMNVNLDGNLSCTDTAQKKIDALAAQLRQLSESHAMMSTNQRAIEGQLGDTDAIARQAQSGLREASALLLPNVAKDPTAGSAFRSVVHQVMHRSAATSGINATQPLSPSAGGKPMTPRGGLIRKVVQAQQSGDMKPIERAEPWA